jgi:hypothetical protein
MPFRATYGYTPLSHSVLVALVAEGVESCLSDDHSSDYVVTLSVKQVPYYLVACLPGQGVVHFWPVDCDASNAVTLVVVDIDGFPRNISPLSVGRFSYELMS